MTQIQNGLFYVLQAAQNLSLSVGSVCNYSRRVIAALRHLRNRFLSWPNPDRKDLISASIEERSGFRNCLGAGDGSLIRLLAMPTEHASFYFLRNGMARFRVRYDNLEEFRFVGSMLPYNAILNPPVQ
ncbi:hypothetical protein FB446DRAFT_775417 [Lentinula raphanica]|nr:hypothetical protein FB446DRAFT_775417 [Lentinula raphanica]